MRSVRDIPHFDNIPILVRAAMNEPVASGLVTDSFRLMRAVTTLKFLSEQRARVIVISHIGEAGTETLEPVAQALGKLIPRVSFCPQTIGSVARDAIRKMSPGDILVLENLRRNPGEVANSSEFAKELALLADVFVQDSFDTCHRKHASIIGVPKLLPSYAGLVVEQEVHELTKALRPTSPSLAIIGGAKFSTKEPVLARLLESYDRVFVGGALASDFIQAEGHPVGKSLVSGADPAKVKELMQNPKLALPIDSIVTDASDMHPTRARTATLDNIKENEMIVDHGPGTEALVAGLVKGSKSILWNGPFGRYENGFVDATDELAKDIAMSGAYSVIGGGDTIAAIEKLNILDKFSFISTGGGAMLDFLSSGTLPGITALN